MGTLIAPNPTILNTFIMKNAVVSSLLVSGAAAFPWVAMQPGVDSSILRLKPRQQVGEGPGGPDTCPFNANHEGARPVTDEYPYNNAKDGIPVMARAVTKCQPLVTLLISSKHQTTVKTSEVHALV